MCGWRLKTWWRLTILLWLLSGLTACGSQPKGNWGDALQFQWQPAQNRWEIAKVGLDRFHADCAFTPSPSDDPVVDAPTPGRVLLTDAYVTALLKTCERNKKVK